MRTGVLVVALFVVLASHGALAAKKTHKPSSKPSDPVTGLWRTGDGDGVIQLYACGEQICGRFYWLKDDSPDDVSRDTANSVPAKRQRPLCGMPFMGGFTLTAPGHYDGGWIYSPQSGATYSAQMTLKNNDTLDLHGYVLLPALGESRTWTRVQSSPRCVTAFWP